jgi:hypothetical protein
MTWDYDFQENSKRDIFSLFATKFLIKVQHFWIFSTGFKYERKFKKSANR